jgi:hypothetical protein
MLADKSLAKLSSERTQQLMETDAGNPEPNIRWSSESLVEELGEELRDLKDREFMRRPTDLCNLDP